MKKSIFISLVLGLFYEMTPAQIASRDKKSSHEIHGMFIDLNTTDLVALCYDSIHHKTLNPINQKEIIFFINPETGDTLYGRGVYAVNGFVIKGTDNKYHLSPNLVKTEKGELKSKINGAKLKNCKNQIKNMNCANQLEPGVGHNKSKETDKTRISARSDTSEDKKLKNESAKNSQSAKIIRSRP